MGLRWDKLFEMTKVAERREEGNAEPVPDERQIREDTPCSEMLQLARQLIEKNERSRAEKILLALQSKREIDESSLKESCGLLEKIGNYEAAYNGYEMIRSINPSAAYPLYSIGRILEIEGRLSEALDYHRQAVEREPGNPECYFRMGIAYTKSHQYTKAEKSYRQAIILDPTHSKSYTNLGYILDMHGKQDVAMQQFLKAVQYNPKSAEAHFNLGALYGEEGNKEQAINEFRIGLEISPRCVEGRYNLALALINEGQYDEAMEEFRKIIKLEADNVNALFYLGFLYYRKGVYKKALKYLKKASELNPGNAKILFYTGECLNNLEQPGEAVDYYKEVININPEDRKAYFSLAVTYEKRGELEKARECYRNAARAPRPKAVTEQREIIE